EIELLALFFFVERGRAGSQHVLNIFRYSQSLFFHTRDRFLNANRIPNFKWTELPSKAPAHRTIDFNNIVGNLGYSLRSVGQRSRHRLPEKRANAIFAPS